MGLFTNTYIHTEYVPKQLAKALLSLPLSNTNKDHALSIVTKDILYNPRQGKYLIGGVALPQTYLRKKYGGGYHKVMKSLLKADIVRTNHSYSTHHHYCKKYFINPELLENPDMVEVTYKKKYKKNRELNAIEQDTLEVFQQVSLDYTGAVRRMRQYLFNQDYMQKIYVDHEITEKQFEVTFVGDTATLVNYRTYRTSLPKALAQAKACGVNLIQDGQKFYLVKLGAYKQIKHLNVHISHSRALLKLKKGIFYAHINETNHRLDTPITNLPNIYLDFLQIEDQKIVNIDIRNSQITLLAYLLKGNTTTTNTSLHNVHKLKVVNPTPNTKTFISKAETGVLYEYMQELLELKSRKSAKLTCFRSLFSSFRWHGVENKLFRQAFPEVFQQISAFKKEFGDNQLAIMLQRLESSLVVGNLLPKLRRMGYVVLSKHDSLLVREADVPQVHTLFEEHLKENHLTAEIVAEV